MEWILEDWQTSLNREFCIEFHIHRSCQILYFVLRNWERFGLGVIQCGISLGLQNQFRPKLIDKIFNVDFLGKSKKLENS